MKRLIVLASILLLTACGGSDEEPDAPSSSGDLSWQEGVFPESNQFKNFCETPRTGIDPFTDQPYLDRQGSSADEKFWLRSWSDEFYLWYDEIIDRDPTDFTVLGYFNQLKTNELTNSGNPRDNFHFSQETASSNDFFQNGVSVSTGIQWRIINPGVPREIRVVFVEPTSEAALVGIKRGDRLLEVDGINVINTTNNANIDIINRALFPQGLYETYEYTFQDTDANRFDVRLAAREIVNSPVLYSDIINTPTGNVGYMVFNDHTRIAEQALIDTINTFIDAQVTDVILDLRYNGGGFLSVASRLAYMLSGPKSNNRVFERIVLNDKHTQVNPFTGSTLRPTAFFNRSSSDNPLPFIELDRLYVITTGNTCSASESVINGLRGLDTEVIQIGSKTCGKPFGFYGTDNCGTTYFSINFRGENDKGFGDYADGFIPRDEDNGEDFIRGCTINSDDLLHLLGDTNERFLSTALYFRDNDACPTQSTSIEKTSLFEIRDKPFTIEKTELRKNKYLGN